MRTTALKISLTLCLVAFFMLPSYAQIKVYTMNGCGRCAYTVKYLTDNKIAFTEYNTTTNDANNTAMWALLEGKHKGGTISMPVISNNGEVAFSIKNLTEYVETIAKGKTPNNNNNTNTDSDEVVTIFEHSNYQGKSQQLEFGEYDLADLSIGNDKLSSLKIPQGFKVTLYEHANFAGKSLVLTENKTYIGNEFNDKTSSIVIEGEEEEPNTEPENNNNNNNNNGALSFKGCATGKEVVPADNEAFEKKVLELVNAERKKVGKSALVWSPSLARAARYHAADMATENYFDHDSHDVENGVKTLVCDTFERIGKFGAGYAENIAWGSTSPEGAMNQWMNSKGHKANILSDNKAMGVGYYKGYWVQVLGAQ